MTPRQVFRTRLVLSRLTDALVESILEAPDEDIIAELREEGLDPDRVATDMRAAFDRMFPPTPRTDA